MSGPEFSDEEFERIERLVDQGVATFKDAKEQVASERPRLPLGEVATRATTEHIAPKATTEVPATWSVNHTGVDDEQRAINQDGIALARKMGELVNLDEYRALGPEGQQAMRDALIARHNATKHN